MSLRKLFFQGRQSLGRSTITLTRQSESSDPALQKYRENVRCSRGGVTFLTLHVVGSNNGLGRTAEGDALSKVERLRHRDDRAWPILKTFVALCRSQRGSRCNDCVWPHRAVVVL